MLLGLHGRTLLLLTHSLQNACSLSRGVVSAQQPCRVALADMSQHVSSDGFSAW